MTNDIKKPYHDALVASWRVFIKDRKEEQFSEAWWKEIIGEYKALSDSYKDTPIHDYVSYMNQVFLDEYERVQKRVRQKGISEGVLPEAQGYHQEELQLTDSIPEVGGDKEDHEAFTASDWG